MIGMERLDSPKNILAEYGSFAEALKTVRENLAKGVGKTTKVYEVVMPDRKLAVFGVAMNDSANNDGEWIKRIDMQDNIAGLPYEIYVVNTEVGAPHGRFRIALAFPDVGMGQFMRISTLPNAIIETMSAVAGAEKKSSEESGSKAAACAGRKGALHCNAPFFICGPECGCAVTLANTKEA